MKACLKTVIVLLAVTLVAASSTKFVSTWRHPLGGNLAGLKVATFLVNPDPSMRMGPEETLAAELRRRGHDAVAGHIVLPVPLTQDKEKAKEFLTKAGITGAIVMRLVAEGETRRPNVYYSQGYYPSFWGYWNYGWSATYVVGSSDTDKVFFVETLVYSVELDRLLWAGESETVNPEGVREFIRDLVNAAGEEMRKAGLVK